MSGIASNEEAQARLRSREERREQQEREDLRAVLRTIEGRRLVWRFIDDVAGAFSRSYVGDTTGTIFNEGRRSIGLALMVEAQRASHADYVHMMAEALQSKQEDEMHRRDAELAAETGE